MKNSKELPTDIPIVPYVHTLRKNDTEQNSTNQQHLLQEYAGFRPGKSCTSQLLNITQHIEDGYQESMITGISFVDLSAAYDTVNHRILIQKLFNIIILANETGGNYRRMACQNGVFSSQLFSTYPVYTNDKLVHDGTRSFIYANDLYHSPVPYLHTRREHY